MADLQRCRAKIDVASSKLADFPRAIEEQKSKLRISAKRFTDLSKEIKPLPGSDAEDREVVKGIDSIRLRAIEAIRKFLS